MKSYCSLSGELTTLHMKVVTPPLVGGHGAGRKQLLVNVIAQTVLEPVAERNGESLFFAPEELRGKVALHGLAQQIFLTALRQLGFEGNAVHQLDKPVIEKRRAYLQAVRHAHAV